MNGCSLEKNCNEALGKPIRQNDVRNDQGFLSSIFQLAIAQSCGYAVIYYLLKCPRVSAGLAACVIAFDPGEYLRESEVVS